MLPYLYAYAHKTTTTGEQLIKPLFMNYDDPNAYGKDYQYMFGNEMMVAPVLDEGQTTIDVYFPKLPEGQQWISLWDEKTYDGGQTVEIDAPLESIPVFVPQGSIIPLGKVKKHVGASKDDTLTLKIYPSEHAEFVLYEDDGKSRDYVQGGKAETKFTADYQGENLEINIGATEGQYEGMLEERVYNLEIHLIDSFDKITIDGKEVEATMSVANVVQLSVPTTVSNGQQITIHNAEI